MIGRWMVLATVLAATGCASGGIGTPYPEDGGVIIVGERTGRRGDRDDRRDDRGYDHDGPRELREVPPGHYPPPGECRLWYPDRPPGHQPPPTKCGALYGRVPYDAFILYNEKAWDAGYDWRRHAVREPGSVPELILDLVASLRERR